MSKELPKLSEIKKKVSDAEKAVKKATEQNENDKKDTKQTEKDKKDTKQTEKKATKQTEKDTKDTLIKIAINKTKEAIDQVVDGKNKMRSIGITYEKKYNNLKKQKEEYEKSIKDGELNKDISTVYGEILTKNSLSKNISGDIDVRTEINIEPNKETQQELKVKIQKLSEAILGIKQKIDELNKQP